MVTAVDLYKEASRVLGERIGVMGTVTVGMSTTTIVLEGLINTTGDDTFYAGYRLIFMDDDGELNERLVTTWADATGTATILNTTVPAVADNLYILVARQDYTLNEYRIALGVALNRTPRTYRQVIALTPLLWDYPLAQCDWLTGMGDVDAVYLTQSPLMLHNEDMSLWQNGASAAPDGFTLQGTGATVSRVVGGIRSSYAATLTAGAGTLRLVQAIPEPLSQWLTRRTFPVFTPLGAAAWAKTTDANSVRVFIRYSTSASGSPVTTYAYSDYMDADGSPQFPSLSLQIDADQDRFEWGIEVLTLKSVTLSWAGLMQNTLDFPSSFSIKDAGSQALPYKEFEWNHVVRNVGGVPTVELQSYPSTYGQLVVYCRRPFPVYSSDSDTYDDQYERALTAGLLNFMLEVEKPQQDRQRLDSIRTKQASIWTRMANNFTDLPVPKPPVRREILGA